MKKKIIETTIGILAVVILGTIFALIIPPKPALSLNFTNQDKNYTELTQTATIASTSTPTPEPTVTATPTITPTPTSTPTPLAPGTTVMVLATAYNGEEPGGGNFITATGCPTKWGIVAVGPILIPLGTRLKIDAFPGIIFVAADTGGGIKGLHIDIWMDSVEKAKKWGRKWVKVTILQ
ncbi:3D domain-containing protein [Patescibacteria group bacterium]